MNWLQLLVNQLEPLTEQQLVGITNLQQSSQQAEDALSQGMEALQQSLSETLSTGSLGSSGSSGNVANYMGQMAMAMGKLGTLEGFIKQVCFSYSHVCDQFGTYFSKKMLFHTAFHGRLLITNITIKITWLCLFLWSFERLTTCASRRCIKFTAY